MTPPPSHPNAPLTPEGRERLCRRIDAGRPLSHVAAEGGISRASLTKWYKRWLAYGRDGLEDRTSRPDFSPTATDEDIVDMVLQLRAFEKWGADRISAYLSTVGDGSIAPSRATVHRILVRHGMSRLRDLDMPTGESKRDANRYEHARPGDMIHVDIKKVGRIPTGGGWRIHGRNTEGGRASQRKANKRVGYAYIHAAVDDHSRLAYAEVLDDEKKETCAAFWFRAVAFFREQPGGSHTGVFSCREVSAVGTKRTTLRVADPGEKPAAAKKLSLVEAIESGSYEDILRAQRRDAVKSLATLGGPALAAMHRQIASLSKEIEGLEQAKTEGTDIGAAIATPDEEFDAEAL
ncbi:helix-turn-helix domain-containing protein [Pimelobacter simplex]|uniref:helix-turn-helix domain-containing protein n=1 Tax=Nocardioides simplex TaxID=2045 RepID=UPI00214F805E|nr:helix-turn-helix domain-containing protein [Pimelobacter simplex]UUW87411.1 DDE-type integrase/transposase/recombinase [Pimelobacter simplex]UUW96916.1 DDE-type integrase/transposase/recombinase [Pimelobacter simplex]